ncbi:MAG: NUDIX hydrolase [Alphaproteobacteria bacterium]
MENSSNKLIPASTVLVIRDGLDDIEVFMVVRHHQIDFASGALVFPGGKVDESDLNPEIRRHIVTETEISDEELSYKIAGIRECYEEANVLFAYEQNEKEIISSERLEKLAKWREEFNNKKGSMFDFAVKENIKFNLDNLILFAHWITPEMMPKRFDTYFYLAEAPKDHIGKHDGKESVDSIWISPKQALEDCLTKKRTIIFPTKMNLEKLSKFRTVKEALDEIKKETVFTVEPKIEKNEDGVFLTIPEEAGYGLIKEPIENLK